MGLDLIIFVPSTIKSLKNQTASVLIPVSPAATERSGWQKLRDGAPFPPPLPKAKLVLLSFSCNLPVTYPLFFSLL